jgi:hypothetical protein
MLGVVGLLAPEFFHLPQFTPGATPYESAFTVSQLHHALACRNYAALGTATLPFPHCLAWQPH